MDAYIYEDGIQQGYEQEYSVYVDESIRCAHRHNNMSDGVFEDVADEYEE